MWSTVMFLKERKELTSFFCVTCIILIRLFYDSNIDVPVLFYVSVFGGLSLSQHPSLVLPSNTTLLHPHRSGEGQMSTVDEQVSSSLSNGPAPAILLDSSYDDVTTDQYKEIAANPYVHLPPVSRRHRNSTTSIDRLSASDRKWSERMKKRRQSLPAFSSAFDVSFFS
jgi:hypothetical protein